MPQYEVVRGKVFVRVDVSKIFFVKSVPGWLHVISAF
jgi:hypothetical protein